jgi:hypothetical protein
MSTPPSTCSMRTGADAIVSVVEVPHQFNPASLMRLITNAFACRRGPDVLRRQDKPRLYARNGPAVLAVRVAQL